MLGSFRAIKFGVAVLATSAMLAVTPTLSHAATGSVRITISRTGFIFGGGSGTLHFQGKRYALRVGGVSVGPLGAPSVDLVGRAYHMRTAANIHGRYSAVVADAASSGGARVIRLQNWQGVVLELRGRRGVKPAVDLSGLEISLRQKSSGREFTSNVRGPNRRASSGGNAGAPSGHASSDATAHPLNS